MSRYAVFGFVLLAAGAMMLWAQKGRDAQQQGLPTWEVKSLLPQEATPARYRQVSRQELDEATRDGWELVAVTPYVYLNEERGTRTDLARPMVTQAYPAYFFKRLKKDRF